MPDHLRPLRLPPPDFAQINVPVTPYPGRELWRLHGQGQSAIYFSLNPEHRFSHEQCPAKVLYLGEELTTCLWERFGDDILNVDARVSESLWRTRELSRVQVPELRLCDLTDELTRSRAKVDVSALVHTALSAPKAWGLAIQQHPASFDGLRYRSRFDNQPCVALFDRGPLAANLREIPVVDLPSSVEAEDFLDQHRIALV
jgi:hypothetical protein